VPLSRDFNWPIAHHLHNHSFLTQNPHNGETAYPINPCIRLVMANTFVKGKTFIYDHLARREVVDGLVNYPEHILRCHEAWLLKIRRNILAKVEILYGRFKEGCSVYTISNGCPSGTDTEVLQLTLPKAMLFSGLFGLHAHFSLSTQDVPVFRVIFSNLHSDIYK